MMKTMLTTVPDLDRWESARGYPLLAESALAHESEEWRSAAERTRPVLLASNRAEPADTSVALSY